jgi:hypothetical protein
MAASRTGNRRRKAGIITLSIGGLALFFVLMYSSMISTIAVDYFFDYSFEKYGVYDSFGREDALGRSRMIVNFILHGDGMDETFLKEDEISHLEDVKHLVAKFRAIYLLSILALLILLMVYGINILNSSKIVLIMILLLSLIYLASDFDFVFQKFHEYFFTGNYAFDPSVSNMKALYPDSLFMFFSLVVFFKLAIKATAIYFCKVLLTSRKIGVV